ncbi:MAG: Gfo/Idh/MocA family oxidoreductase [Planctomycetia bacterium]|nr:Gfo/Idh/MocA family oxidoreductase [Planctomycetia bacterium]
MKLQLPEIPYLPRDPVSYRPPIALVGCGGITSYHLRAYRSAGYHVAALCDLREEFALKRQAEFYPEAAVYADYRQMLERPDIEVVDVATHPAIRPAIIEDCLRAGKHVLSQKPFVLDLEVGRKLVRLADEVGRKLAVNQNGRWAPYFSYMRQAITQGVIGRPTAAHLAVHWNHGWVKGTEFERIRHLILFDFAIHWFDILCCFMGDQNPKRVFASMARTATQQIVPPLLAQVLIEYDSAQASLVFDADTRHGPLETTYVTGELGTLSSTGVDSNRQRVSLSVGRQKRRPLLTGQWFPDGFHGTMGELLLAIEENRQPSHSAADNLRSLELCFAAVASAERGEPMLPGSVSQLPIITETHDSSAA